MIDRFEQFSLCISEISRYWHKLATDELAKYGLKGSHARYLTTMYQYPEGITVPELCEITGKDKADASRMIPILEKKGLVIRQVVRGSLYRAKLLLTEEGRIAAEHVTKRACRAVEVAGKDLNADEREQFYRALDSITANLRELSIEGIPD